MQASSNFEVDLDDLRRAHGALGAVVAVNEQVARALPVPGSPVSTDAAVSMEVPAGSVVLSAPRALVAYTALVGRLAQRQSQGIEAIAETRRRLVDIETAYRAADRLG